uniref:DUF148 domain-containing protein n=1 Tax=Rhabditophanes sp. KR3021 TaxID=114890 RepID=A0AC35TM42_9BILA
MKNNWIKIVLMVCLLSIACVSMPNKYSINGQIDEVGEDGIRLSLAPQDFLTTQAIIEQVPDKINKMEESIGEKVNERTNTIGEAVADKTNTMKEAVTDKTSGMGEAISDKASTIKEAIGENTNEAVDKTTHLGSEVAEGAKEMVSDSANTIENASTNAEELATEQSTGLGTTLSNAAKSVGSVLSTGANAVANFITGNDQGIVSTLSTNTQVLTPIFKRNSDIVSDQTPGLNESAVVSSDNLRTLNEETSQMTNQIPSTVQTETSKNRRDLGGRIDNGLTGAKDMHPETKDPTESSDIPTDEVTLGTVKSMEREVRTVLEEVHHLQLPQTENNDSEDIFGNMVETTTSTVKKVGPVTKINESSTAESASRDTRSVNYGDVNIHHFDKKLYSECD